MSVERKSHGFTLRLTVKDQGELRALSDRYRLNRTDTLRRAVREALGRVARAQCFSGYFTSLRAGRRGRPLSIECVRKGHPDVR